MPSSLQDYEFASEMQQHLSLDKTALDSAISWIGKELDPEDVFSEKKLEQWAEANGWVKE